MKASILLVFLIFGLFLVSGFNGCVQEVEEEIEGDLISKCKKSLDECKEITKEKWDASISLIKELKISSLDEGEEFYNTWKGIAQPYSLRIEIENFGDPLEFPMVLLATKVVGPGGQVPLVAVCNKEGDLIKSSRVALLCGS